MQFFKLTISVILLFTMFLQVHGQDKGTTAVHKKIVHQIFEEGVNKKNTAVFDRFYTADVIDHSAFPQQKPGLEGVKQSVKDMLEGFLDVRVEVQDVIAEGDLVSTRESWSAKDKTSGKNLNGWVLHIFKFKNGKISEEWSKGWEWLSGMQ